VVVPLRALELGLKYGGAGVRHGLGAGLAQERAARLVAADGAVLVNAREDQLEAAGGLDRVLVALALLDSVLHGAVQHVRVLLQDVDLAVKVLPDEGVVTGAVACRQVGVSAAAAAAAAEEEEEDEEEEEEEKEEGYDEEEGQSVTRREEASAAHAYSSITNAATCLKLTFFSSTASIRSLKI
jgi:hypothetical protein